MHISEYAKKLHIVV